MKKQKKNLKTFNMKIVSLIISIDGEFPSYEDEIDIKMTCCNNCGNPYRYGTVIIFVRLTKDKLIWWHEFSCDSHKKNEKKSI